MSQFLIRVELPIKPKFTLPFFLMLIGHSYQYKQNSVVGEFDPVHDFLLVNNYIIYYHSLCSFDIFQIKLCLSFIKVENVRIVNHRGIKF